MTLSDYHDLKQQIVLTLGQGVKHSQILNTLKERYKEEIDSPRRFESINTVGQLLKILEIRNVLSEDNVITLKEIVSELPNNIELMREIDEYEIKPKPKYFTNNYVIDRHQNISYKGSVETINYNTCGKISKRKMEQIEKTIVDEIGNSWRDLARNLGIREYVIDEIDDSNQNLRAKALNLIDYMNKTDPQKWFFALCEALDKTRRKDISRTLQHIMSMNI